jgi:type I restriction enzyme S subunit
VFGDHTRIFKFIDHPFVLGADGVRVLTPKPKVNPLFAYWHCKLLNIPSAGYSRHFKYLKEKSFICPDEALQNRFSDLTQTAMSQTAVLEKAAAKVEQIFSVLLDNAFSGQLTAQWREAHMKELLAEIEQQARLLDLPMPIERDALL